MDTYKKKKGLLSKLAVKDLLNLVIRLGCLLQMRCPTHNQNAEYNLSEAL